ncbi:hypothetical protein ACFE04_030983 [Oxalis oulophora]
MSDKKELAELRKKKRRPLYYVEHITCPRDVLRLGLAIERGYRSMTEAAIIHYGSVSLIDEPCRSAHLAAMDIAKKSADAARKGIMSIWNEADIIKISEEEIEFLTGGEDLKNLYHPKLKLLLVTEGPAGCRYYTKPE